MTGFDSELMYAEKDQNGQSIAELSHRSPVLVVFLRHSGCPFCRQTLAELSALRSEFPTMETQIVLVHMMPEMQAKELFARYGLSDVSRISDPQQRLYREFGLQRGTWGQVMGPRIWWQGFKSTILKGNKPGKPIGDVFQLPGAFLVVDGQIIRSHRYRHSADSPDFVDLATCEISTSNGPDS